ncbi:hypothetical protein ACJ5H2_10425 [Nocardioides sp. R1-1]|uniref:hypothetical protein n=1 Tax=Nocardioides sp. R1-1 TaxID=3383502 RepID=UPI0038CF9583
MAPPDWKRYTPDETPDPDGPAGAAPAPYRPPQPPRKVRSLEERTVRRRGVHPAGALIAGVGVLAAVGLPVLLAVGGGEDPPGAGEPQTDRGFDALVAALREERGSTLVRRAVVYPEYASVTAPYRPDDPADERELSYYWDGDLDEPTKGTSDDESFDLADVDSAVLAGLCPQVERLVEDPETCYLIIDSPPAGDETPAWISAYASNEFNQTAYVEFGLDGAVVEEHPPS